VLQPLPKMMHNVQILFPSRKQKQQELLNLPLFATTTIGSFPQTAEVRSWRAQLKKGAINQAQYDLHIAEETEKAVKWQEEIDLDVLVHGEFERNDMVEYFGEQLARLYLYPKRMGTKLWQPLCKPPIIYGDVSRPRCYDG
jgi:5-methyltetrahydropteroyltriglutamate--homocysteine methyltransferase